MDKIAKSNQCKIKVQYMVEKVLLLQDVGDPESSKTREKLQCSWPLAFHCCFQVQKQQASKPPKQKHSPCGLSPLKSWAHSSSCSPSFPAIDHSSVVFTHSNNNLAPEYMNGGHWHVQTKKLEYDLCKKHGESSTLYLISSFWCTCTNSKVQLLNNDHCLYLTPYQIIFLIK